MLREGGGYVVGGDGGEGGGVSSCMRGELLVGRYQRVSGMPFPFTADQQRFWNPFSKPQFVPTASRPRSPNISLTFYGKREGREADHPGWDGIGV